MADALSSAGVGDNSVSQAAYLEFVDRYLDRDNEVRQAVALRNKLRQEIKAAGIPLAAFDRTRKDMEKSGSVREAEDAWYRRMMGWLKKPVGFQASMDLRSTDPNEIAFNTHELHAIDTQGFEAGGKGGKKRETNPYTPGTEGYQRWDIAWVRGQAELARDMAPDAASAAAVDHALNGGVAPAKKRSRRAPGEPPRPRGRPRKNPPQAVTGDGTGDEPGPALH